MIEYYKKFIGKGLIILGSYFLIEHYVVWGALNFWDFLGHEQFGLVFVITGILLMFDYSYPTWLKEKNEKKIKTLEDIIK